MGHVYAGTAADEQWQVAEQYYRAGDWHGAELEYLRHGVLYNDDERCPEGVRLRALCRWRDDAPADALQLLSAAVDGGSDAATGTLLAAMLMEQGYHRLAAFRLRTLAQHDAAAADIRFLQGWNDLLAFRFQGAQVHLASVTDGPYADKARALVPRAGQLAVTRQKHPALAGWLSFLVPGSGQAYCGRWWEAAGSLGVNALFGWWVYTLAQDKNYWAAAGVYALGGIRYHLGGTLQAVRTAEKINRTWQRDRIQELKDEYGYPEPGDEDR